MRAKRTGGSGRSPARSISAWTESLRARFSKSIFIGLASHGQSQRFHADVPHQHQILTTTVGEQNGESAVGIRRSLAGDLRLDRHNFGRIGDRLTGGPGDFSGDDVGGSADLRKKVRR
jgi:hypothetical protein